MDAEDYEVTPINYKCNNVPNPTVISDKPGSNVSNTNNSVESVNYQQKVYSQYDSTEEIDVKPMYGGSKFYIIFKKKDYYIEGKNQKEAIQKFLNNRIFKSEQLLIINNKDTYIIKANYKNKYRKV